MDSGESLSLAFKNWSIGKLFRKFVFFYAPDKIYKIKKANSGNKRDKDREDNPILIAESVNIRMKIKNT